MTTHTQPQPQPAAQTLLSQPAVQTLLMTKTEVTHTFRIGMGKLNDMLRKGELPKVKIGRRCLIPTAAVEAYAARIIAGEGA